MGESYQQIRLQDLSLADTQRMVESILKTDAIPEELRQYIQEKVGGNPFYLEEMLNSLIESGTLRAGAATGNSPGPLLTPISRRPSTRSFPAG